MLCLDSCYDFVWTDTGGESVAFLDGGPTEETSCIFARRSSCKQSGKQRCIYLLAGSCRTYSILTMCSLFHDSDKWWVSWDIAKVACRGHKGAFTWLLLFELPMLHPLPFLFELVGNLPIRAILTQYIMFCWNNMEVKIKCKKDNNNNNTTMTTTTATNPVDPKQS